MNKEKILKERDLAIKQDRERFFKIADTLHLQPKYKNRLAELEALKQEWRDITDLPDYPNITHPLSLPEWFPVVHFASCFEKNEYLEHSMNAEKSIAENTIE